MFEVEVVTAYLRYHTHLLTRAIPSFLLSWGPERLAADFAVPAIQLALITRIFISPNSTCSDSSWKIPNPLACYRQLSDPTVTAEDWTQGITQDSCDPNPTSKQFKLNTRFRQVRHPVAFFLLTIDKLCRETPSNYPRASRPPALRFSSPAPAL
ncbi:hypothetical protein VTJ04DRAFT_4948 [Mycothermus thermophilus]|uniref:uncharacterized protein n=1 Tax=Humicola insolens TaxID=85995 RepID=UPI003743647C